MMGLLGYAFLPISALPAVDFPTIEVVAKLPGASPEVMASSVTTPLERNFGQISGLTSMISIGLPISHIAFSPEVTNLYSCHQSASAELGCIR